MPRLRDWSLLRQLTGSDRLGRGQAAQSKRSRELEPRIENAEVVKSVCPYCAVGCGQNIYVKNGEITQIEGDPDAPHSRGRLCPKGSATKQLTSPDAREEYVLYRPPHGTDWQRLDLETAMDMVTERVLAARDEGWQDEEDGVAVNRTLGLASLGGATLDNEENYLIRKLLCSLGVVQVENQARVCHSSTVVGLGTSFGRGGSTTFPGDLQNADCIVIEGSNMAEAHPVAFQWVMEAKARGAKVIHVDPHFSRTSAMADLFLPIRAGTDIAFLGGVINHVLENELYFEEYVKAYTNASTILDEHFSDTEDGDGFFSGWDEANHAYDISTWAYDGVRTTAASGDRDQYDLLHGSDKRRHDSWATVERGAKAPTDPTLQHPRCVFQVLKRHYARYTPEMVQATCGITPEQFGEFCSMVTDNSTPERTTSFVYAVGWTQHTTGSQNIRCASILQLLLGNIGRPGGGIEAMRGHASIQGSSDIPTLFDTLPGYLPTPKAHEHQSLKTYLESDQADRGYWANMPDYLVSMLKAWWGDAATEHNDWCFDHMPRITGSYGTYDTVMHQIEGTCKGYFLMGQNPAVGSANNRMQRLGMSKLDWLVVRDFSLIESATWWKDGPEIETGEMKTEEIGTEVFFFPAAAHTEKDGTFTNTQRMLQWHHKAVEPSGDRRSDLWFMYHLGLRIREKLKGSKRPRDRGVLDLTWDYPTEGPTDEPSADAVLREINGFASDGEPLSTYTELKSDGSTSCGAWIYCGVYADGVNQADRRKPKEQQNWTGGEWGWAWPSNRRILYNRASADPDGRPWSQRKALVWWDEEQATWVGHDTPDFDATMRPDYEPPDGTLGPEGLSGSDPFILQADGRGWLYAPAGLPDGPMPTHFEPQDSPLDNPLYSQSRNPVRATYEHVDNRYHPSGSEPGAEVYPCVLTTYRLTEHFTSGGMSRWTPYLSELQPELFCEISPALALDRGIENGGWATLISARGVVEARVLVTRRMAPLRLGGRLVHQIGMPFHWGPNGHSKGDSPNELLAVSVDATSRIQEDKALTVEIREGRRPTGADRPKLVEEYRRRAGVDSETGMNRGWRVGEQARAGAS